MGFTTLIIGYFFIFFNFNLGEVNVLPDFIGYILLFFGASEIIRRIGNPNFLPLKKASLLLLALSLLNLIIKNNPILNDALNNSASLDAKIYSVISLGLIVGLSIFFFSKLSKGIGEEAEKLGEAELAGKAAKVYKVYLLFQGISSLIFIAAILFAKGNGTYNLGAGVLPIFLAGVIVFIYLFVQVWKLLKLAESKFKGAFPIQP